MARVRIGWSSGQLTAGQDQRVQLIQACKRNHAKLHMADSQIAQLQSTLVAVEAEANTKVQTVLSEVNAAQLKIVVLEKQIVAYQEAQRAAHCTVAYAV